MRDGPLDHVGHIRHETSLIRAALVSADPSAPVPSCAGWTADDLLRHLAARTPVDADLATDGVDEVLTYFFSGTAQSRFRPTGPVGELRTLDTGAAWAVELGEITGPSRDGRGYDDRRPGFRVAAHAQPTFGISAAAATLDAWLWGRPVDADVTVHGEPHDAAPFTAVIGGGIR